MSRNRFIQANLLSLVTMGSLLLTSARAVSAPPAAPAAAPEVDPSGKFYIPSATLMPDPKFEVSTQGIGLAGSGAKDGQILEFWQEKVFKSEGESVWIGRDGMPSANQEMYVTQDVHAIGRIMRFAEHRPSPLPAWAHAYEDKVPGGVRGAPDFLSVQTMSPAVTGVTRHLTSQTICLRGMCQTVTPPTCAKLLANHKDKPEQLLKDLASCVSIAEELKGSIQADQNNAQDAFNKDIKQFQTLKNGSETQKKYQDTKFKMLTPVEMADNAASVYLYAEACQTFKDAKANGIIPDTSPSAASAGARGGGVPVRQSTTPVRR